MRTIVRAFVSIGALAACFACAETSPPDAKAGEANSYQSGLAEMGAEVYARRCAACHGVTGLGDGPAADALRVAPPDLTRIAARRGGSFDDGEVARFIDGRFDIAAHGSREMPVWGERLGEDIPEAGLSEEIVRGQIATLVEYLKSIQRVP